MEDLEIFRNSYVGGKVLIPLNSIDNIGDFDLWSAYGFKVEIYQGVVQILVNPQSIARLIFDELTLEDEEVEMVANTRFDFEGDAVLEIEKYATEGRFVDDIVSDIRCDWKLTDKEKGLIAEQEADYYQERSGRVYEIRKISLLTDPSIW